MASCVPRRSDIDDVPHFLYRCFGEKDKLLYVGMSVSVLRRISEHKLKPWFHGVKIITITAAGNRKEAEILEIQAITEEDPEHNKAYRSFRRPDPIVTKPTPFVPEIKQGPLTEWELRKTKAKGSDVPSWFLTMPCVFEEMKRTTVK